MTASPGEYDEGKRTISTTILSSGRTRFTCASTIGMLSVNSLPSTRTNPCPDCSTYDPTNWWVRRFNTCVTSPDDTDGCAAVLTGQPDQNDVAVGRVMRLRGRDEDIFVGAFRRLAGLRSHEPIAIRGSPKSSNALLGIRFGGDRDQMPGTVPQVVPAVTRCFMARRTSTTSVGSIPN